MGKQVAAGLNGGLAQLGEHLPCKQGVESSNLLVSTCKLKSLHDNKNFGGDALRGNTRSHPEHDG